MQNEPLAVAITGRSGAGLHRWAILSHLKMRTGWVPITGTPVALAPGI